MIALACESELSLACQRAHKASSNNEQRGDIIPGVYIIFGITQRTPATRRAAHVRCWDSTPSRADLVKDRKSGRLSSTALVVARHEGQRFVVSMLGYASEWVQNIRAANGQAFIKRGRLQPVKLTEIPPPDRAAILKTWSRVATSGRRHLPIPPDATLEAFAAIASDYPVFRIETVESEE